MNVFKKKQARLERVKERDKPEKERQRQRKDKGGSRENHKTRESGEREGEVPNKTAS